jgi:hypothetical protein
MEIVKFPCDVVNASKDIELAIVVAHRVAVADSRDFSFVL